jgi:hypothetical protein
MSEEIPKQTNASQTFPIFVVGAVRSGTSLLYALLNQHPQIALMYECNAWDFPEILSPLRFQNDWLERLEFYNRSLSRHRLILGNQVRGLDSVRSPHDLYRLFAETKNASFFGEKSPFYGTRLRQLAKVNPGCSFILIWRDPVEIHRSIEEAARHSNFFRRRGTLNRLIYYQERMIHEADELVRSGNRVHHVVYSDLVDRTEESCRSLCQFLKIEFNQKMLDLAGADLSAVFCAPQFENLRSGKIERRQLSNHALDPDVVQKLERFRSRWERLRHQRFKPPGDSPVRPEPSFPERLYYQFTGASLYAMDGVKRGLLEFLPLSWLRTYRLAKAWFWAGRAAAAINRRPLGEEFWANKVTILLSLLILAIIAVADHATDVAVSLAPFYMIPASILALVVNQRWGTLAAITSSIVWGLVQNIDNPFINLSHLGIWLWDVLMRFMVIEVVVLLLERIRIEISSSKIPGEETKEPVPVPSKNGQASLAEK